MSRRRIWDGRTGHQPIRLRHPYSVWLVAAAMTLVILAIAGLVWMGVDRARIERRMFATPPDEVATRPDLMRFAANQAKPLFADHCAVCHGADMKGRSATGAPNLTDGHWLYGDGSVFQIERIILYGIRSNQKKSYDVTEMPAFGQRGLLSDSDINNVVQYLLRLNHRPYAAEAADQGKMVFYGTASCNDCHSQDARGNSDYGAPDLTAGIWDYGGSSDALYNSIYYGRHGVMPASVGMLTLEQIRALALYVHAASYQ